MSNITETIITTLTSGALTAVGAYTAIVWKLSRRVAVLEEKVEALDKKTEAVRVEEEALEDKFGDLRVDVTSQLSDMKEDMAKRLSDLSYNIMQKLDAVQTKLTEDLSDFRSNCAARTGRYASRVSLEQYVKEEERRWQEFYRAVGKLEALLDRALLKSTPPPPRLTRSGPQKE
jgi:outer membrane murein-binding lipoprotein Lpp